jgi:hypothetical protein
VAVERLPPALQAGIVAPPARRPDHRFSLIFSIAPQQWLDLALLQHNAIE